MFLIYTNDFASSVSDEFSVNYADDTSLGCRGQTTFDLESAMNDLLFKADSWFISNRLVAKASESSFMCITTRQNTLNISNIKIKLDGQDLTQCSCTKLLGINIDKHLTFDEHIKYIATKVSSKIGLIHRLRQFLPVSVLNTVYITMIQSHFDYCITVWGFITKKNNYFFKDFKIAVPELLRVNLIILFCLPHLFIT